MYTPFVLGVCAHDHRPVRVHRRDLGPCRQQDDAIPRELVSRREKIGTCNQKLAQYRVALDSGADPAVVGQWIAEIQVRKLAAHALLRAATAPGRNDDQRNR